MFEEAEEREREPGRNRGISSFGPRKDIGPEPIGSGVILLFFDDDDEDDDDDNNGDVVNYVGSHYELEIIAINAQYLLYES
ncbi:hypothetical protein DUI87_22248 [Hirundo rustica rustica]|uniref:Uncharacterized protein n=1 Tax=Hirundo rustica rustica TaxID=333673 RepID=A0A3M0K1Z6_HIRRU|nr:hypothetical protein DUI87_22248 [Hirundo rustica rustica]